MKYSPDSLYFLYASKDNLYFVGNQKKGQDTIPVQLTTDGEPNYTFNREDEGKVWKDASEPNLLIGFQVAIVFMLFVRITGKCVIYG